MRKSTWIFCLVLALCILQGCGHSPDTSTPELAKDNSPNDPTLRYAQGWSGVLITANFAKTTISPAAHLITTRNACGKDADDVLDLATWNDFATNINQALSAPRLSEAKCYIGDSLSKFDGSAEILVDNQNNIPLLETRTTGEICSTLPDAKVVNSLLSLINQLVLQADRANCPNGWGSG